MHIKRRSRDGHSGRALLFSGSTAFASFAPSSAAPGRFQHLPGAGVASVPLLSGVCPLVAVLAPWLSVGVNRLGKQCLVERNLGVKSADRTALLQVPAAELLHFAGVVALQLLGQPVQDGSILNKGLRVSNGFRPRQNA